MALTAFALADQWSFPSELVTKTFEFGGTKVVLDVDGTKNAGYPPHTLSIHLNGELVARYKNVGFEKIFASKDNKFFVGLSNHGIPGTAFVVFDADGNLLREEKHTFLLPKIYTSLSATIVREWVNLEKPEVDFDVQDGQLRGVYVRGSNQQKYNLIARDLDYAQD